MKRLTIRERVLDEAVQRVADDLYARRALGALWLEPGGTASEWSIRHVRAEFARLWSEKVKHGSEALDRYGHLIKTIARKVGE